MLYLDVNQSGIFVETHKASGAALEKTPGDGSTTVDTVEHSVMNLAAYYLQQKKCG